MIAGNGCAEARARAPEDGNGEELLLPLGEPLLGQSLPRRAIERDRERRRIDVDPLDHRLLQREAERLADQLRKLVELALGLRGPGIRA